MRSTIATTRPQAERAAAERLAAALKATDPDRPAVFGVCGGSSVGIILRRLAEDSEVPWERVHLFLVDERLVPLAHAESNFRLIEETLLRPLRERSLLPEANVHPFPGDEDPAQSIPNYAAELQRLGGRFDVALLSAGEDGHVAGLFPGHAALASEEPFTVLDDAPKPPPRRMTCTPSLLGRTREGLLLFFGERKRDALRRFRDNPIDIGRCPAQIVLGWPTAHICTDLETP